MDDATLGRALGEIAATLTSLIREVEALTKAAMPREVCAEHERLQATVHQQLDQRITDLEGRTSRWWAMVFSAVGSVVAVAALMITLLR